jgi:branched-chain amino acid transport system substrate-binding protein
LFKRFPAIALLGAFALLAGSGPARAAGAPYTIDVIISETGPGAGLGNDEAQAFALAEKAINASGGINGTPVHFAIQDDQTNPQVAVQLTNQVLQKHPLIVIGSSLVASCAAMAPLFVNGPVHFCLSEAFEPPPGSQSFGAGAPTDDLLTPTLRYLREHHLTNIASITTTDASGQQGDRSLDKALLLPENHDLHIVVREHFANSDISVAALAQHVANSDAQAVLAGTAGTPTGTLLRGLADAGVHLPTLTTAANMNVDQLTRYADFIPKDMLFTGFAYFDRATSGPLKTPQTQFYDAFATLGLRPTPPHALAWDPIMIVVAALRRLGTNTTSAQLHTYLENLHDFAGADGDYDFRKNQHGLESDSIVIVRWDPATHYWSPVSGPGGGPVPAKH